MPTSPLSAKAVVQPVEHVSTPEEPRVLPSGRSVLVKVGQSGEEIEVRSPEGDVEVRIVLTDSGPVVRLSAARLELDAAESVAVNCQRFEVTASKGARIASEGGIQMDANELRVKTEQDVHLNGAFIRLNCASSLSDDPAVHAAAEQKRRDALKNAPKRPCGCGESSMETKPDGRSGDEQKSLGAP